MNIALVVFELTYIRKYRCFSRQFSYENLKLMPWYATSGVSGKDRRAVVEIAGFVHNYTETSKPLKLYVLTKSCKKRNLLLI